MWIGLVLVFTLLASLACAAEKAPAPAAVVVPSPVPAADIAKMVQDAIAASPGLSKADLQAAISTQTGQQMTAADVKGAVDSAIEAMPAPKIDTRAITPLIEQAVKAAVPEGTSAEQIAAMVQAAVTAATADVATRGELEVSISKSIKDAASGQLTAKDVQTIVDASVGAMAQSIKASVSFQLEEASKASLVAGKTYTLPLFTRPPAVAEADLDPDQTFHWLIKKKKQHIMPHKTGAVRGRFWMGSVALAPFSLTADGALRAGYVTSYEVSADGMKYTFHIDSEAIFQDGTPITAADVKAFYEWSTFPENQISWGGSSLTMNRVAGHKAVSDGDATTSPGIVAVDEHTLEMTLKDLDQLFPMRFALAIMGILKVPDGSDPDWDEHPIGVGPYEVVWDPDVGDVQLTRADNWWREPGRADGVDIQPLSDYQIHYIMYENGEIDIGTRFPGDVRTSAHKFYDELYVSKGGSIFFGGYDVTAPPFDDINVRKALNHAVDWRTIQEAIWPTYHYPTQIIAPSLPCFDPTREGYVYDPELARKYLADSKYGSASNLPAIVAPVSGAQWISAYEVMQEQLQDNLGVYLSLIRVESGQPPPEGTNMIRSSQGATLPDAGHMVNGLGYSHDPLVRDKAKFINPLIDAYLDAANAAPLDDPRRCENFRAADREIMANYYYFPVFGGTFGPDVLVQPWVANFDMMYYGDFISIPWMQVKTRTR